jgi:hypothetical protein
VNSQFDITKNIALTGVLTKVELLNPHTCLCFGKFFAFGALGNVEAAKELSGRE